MREIRKKAHRENSGLQKDRYSVLGLRKLISRQKFFIFRNLTMPKTVKGDPLRLYDIHCCKISKKLKGDSLEPLQKFRKTKNENFEQSHSAEKFERKR